MYNYISPKWTSSLLYNKQNFGKNKNVTLQLLCPSYLVLSSNFSVLLCRCFFFIL